MAKRSDFLDMLRDIQEDTAPINLTIGAIRNNVVRHDIIVVHDAAPKVLANIMTWVGSFPSETWAKIVNDGLEIGFYK